DLRRAPHGRNRGEAAPGRARSVTLKLVHDSSLSVLSIWLQGSRGALAGRVVLSSGSWRHGEAIVPVLIDRGASLATASVPDTWVAVQTGGMGNTRAERSIDRFE